MTDPFVLDVLREALEFLETEFPVLNDPPATTREMALAVLCHRLRYALRSAGASDPGEDPFGLDEDEGGPCDWEPDPEDDPPPVGEEYRPYGWTPFLWEDPDRPSTPDTDASGSCFSDADPGL